METYKVKVLINGKLVNVLEIYSGTNILEAVRSARIATKRFKGYDVILASSKGIECTYKREAAAKDSVTIYVVQTVELPKSTRAITAYMGTECQRARITAIRLSKKYPGVEVLIKSAHSGIIIKSFTS